MLVAAFLLMTLVPIVLSAPTNTDLDTVKPVDTVPMRGIDQVVAHMQTNAVHSKRQVDMEAKLQAIFHYHCPESLSQVRTFKWRVTWRASDGQIVMYNWKHVDIMDPITVINQDFGTYWHHKFCSYSRTSCCSYTFRAQTTGHLYEHSITLAITTNSNHAYEMPSVVEFCVSMNPHMPNAPQTCPASDRTEVNCEISHIDVSIPQD